MRNAESRARQKAEFHQTLRVIGRKVQMLQHRLFAPSQVHQRGLFLVLLSQTPSSMEGAGGSVKVPRANGAGGARKAEKGVNLGHRLQPAETRQTLPRCG